MKFSIALFSCLFILISCSKQRTISSIDPINWDKRTYNGDFSKFLDSGTTYLPVYSHIYGINEHQEYDLTATVSMRNINIVDTIIVNRANYYSTDGVMIRTYFDKPIYISPLETIEIIIDEKDRMGGSGANFIFEWSKKNSTHEPYFESVMISVSGQQGLSFSTKGIRVN